MAVTLNPVPARNSDPRGPEYHNIPCLIPGAPENVFTSDVQVTFIHLANPSTTDTVAVTIKDRQATPREIVPGVVLEPNSDHIRVFPDAGRFCPGGLTWQASVDGVVVGYVKGRV